MVTVPRPPPTPETQRVYDRNHSYWMFLKDLSDSEPPEKEVTKLDSVIEVKWDKRAQVRRYRYEKGMKTLTGKSMGGKFAPAPSYAPPERKKGYKKKGPRA